MKKQLVFVILALIAFAINAQDNMVRRAMPIIEASKTEKILEPQQAIGVSNFDMINSVNATLSVDRVREAVINNDVKSKVKQTDSENEFTRVATPKKVKTPEKNSRGIVYSLSEGFEGTTGDNLPTGWTRSTTNTTWGLDPAGWLVTDNLTDFGDPLVSNAHGGTKFVGINTYTQRPDCDAWLFSSAMNLTAGTTYTLEFWSIVHGYGINLSFDKLKVHLGTINDATTMASSTVLYNNSSTQMRVWTLVSQTFTVPSTGTYYLGFNAYTKEYDGSHITIDDIAVSEEVLTTDFPWTESFTDTTWPPTDWTRVTVGNAAQQWSRSTTAYSAPACAFHNYGASGVAHEGWLISPAIHLPASGDFELSFYSKTADGGYAPSNGSTILISTSSNSHSSGDFTVVKTLSGTEMTNTSWQSIRISLNDYLGQSIYFAFRYIGTYAHAWSVDDVKIREIPINDIEIISAVYPYTQVPVNQLLHQPFNVTVKNSGLVAQTNISVTVEFNGTVLGTSSPVATLAVGATETFIVTPSAPIAIPLGQNSLKYIVTQNETDDDLSNNTVIRTFTGTESIFATDNGTVTTYYGATNGNVTAGSVYTFTKETTLQKVTASFLGVGNSNAQTVTLRIHELTGPTTVNSTAIYTQSVSKPHITNNYYSEITTELTTFQKLPAGSYFISFTETTTTLNMGLLADTNGEGRICYTMSGTALTASASNAMTVRLTVFDPLDNDLQLIANAFSYTQIPASQAATLPFPTLSGKAFNAGANAQTNVTLSGTYNATSIGSSAPIASLASFATSAEMTVTPNAGTVFSTALGTNNVVYTVSQTETDQNPADNTETFSFEITESTYAVDGVTTTFAGGGVGTAGSRIGNIFTITAPTYLIKVTVAWSASSQMNTNIMLYSRTGSTIPATPIFSQTVVRPAEAGWVDYDISPINLTPGDYYLCIQEITATNYGVACDRVTGRSVYFISGGTGTTLSQATNLGAAAIRMTVVDNITKDVGIESILTPVAGTSINLSAAETVKIKLKNNSSTPISSFALKLELNGALIATETYTASIANGAEVEYTFTSTLDLSADNTYEIKVTAILEDDSFPINDSKSISVTNLVCTIIIVDDAYPWSENFASTAFPPTTCWRNWQIAGSGNWIRNTTASTVHSSPGSAYMSAAAGDRHNVLIPPQFSIPNTGQYILEFWSYTGTPANYGEANNAYSNVLISTASGNPTLESFELLKQLSGSEVTAAWQKICIPLYEYAGEDIYVAFQYTSTASAHGWYIDDIKIWNIADFVDGEITRIITPTAGTYINLTNSEPVKVLIKNYSGTDITGFDLILEVGGSVLATETYSNTIESLGSAEYTFNATLDLSASATYSIKVTIDVEDDEDATNDSKTVSVRNIVCNPINTFPWTENFSATTFPADCWYSQGVPSSATWSRQTSGTFPTCSAHSTPGMMRYNNYDLEPGSKGWITLPEISTLGNALRFSFWMYRTDGVSAYGYDGPDYPDRVNVYISETGNMSDAILLKTVNRCRALDPVETGANGWYQYYVTLPAAEMNTARILFEGVSAYGFNVFVDDFSIYEMSGVIDGYIASIITPQRVGISFSNNEQVKVLVKNYGDVPLSEFDLTLELNGTEIVTETWTGDPIPFGGEVEYTFNAKLDLSAEGIYNVKVTIDVENDEDLTNNTLTKKVTNDSSNITLYGYRIYEDNGNSNAFIEIESADPETVTVVNNYSPASPANALYSGENIEGYFYAYTTTSGTPRNFVKISTDTWTEVASTPITSVPSDITYDHLADVMYGIIGVSSTESELVTIDLETGETTSVGSLGRYAFTIACRLDGDLFIIDGDGNLCQVKKGVGETTVIGSTGITPNYIQSMSFDHNTGRLFWGMSNSDDEGKLIEIDPATGAATDLGFLGGNIELIGIYTPFTIPRHTITISANPAIGGTYTGEGVYKEGAMATVSAITNNCFEFVNWTDFNTGEIVYDGAVYTFPVESDVDLVANFQSGVAVSTFYPTNNQEWTGFSGTETSVRITFNCNIEGSSLAGITVNGETPETAPAIQYSNQVLIYYPFTWDSSYEIVVPSTSILNYHGENILYSITTPVKLDISIFSPGENVTGVAIDAEVSLTFNKNVTTHAMFTPVVTITKTGGGNVSGVSYVAIPFMNPSNKLVIKHDNFEYGSEYTVSIPADVVPAWGVLYGYTTPITWKFTTVELNHTITASVNGGNGQIEPAGPISVTDGGSKTFTITPTTGYKIDQVLIDGVNNPEAVASGTYTFTNVTADHTIVASFTILTYTITTSVGGEGGGAITPSGPVSVNHGGSQTFNIAPATGYQRLRVLVDGVNNPAAVSSGEYTFSNVTANHTIEAIFEQITYTITASVTGGNGSINPNGNFAVNHGDSKTFTFSPNDGYKTQSVLVDGVNNSEAVISGTYTFTNVTANHTISVSFEAVGINIGNISTLSVYPNPTDGKLFINSDVQINTIKVYDASGRLVMDFGKAKSNQVSIDISNLANGVYFVTVDNKTIKVVKR